MLKFAIEFKEEKKLAALQARKKQLEACLENLKEKEKSANIDEKTRTTYKTLIVAIQTEIESINKQVDETKKSLANMRNKEKNKFEESSLAPHKSEQNHSKYRQEINNTTPVVLNAQDSAFNEIADIPQLVDETLTDLIESNQTQVVRKIQEIDDVLARLLELASSLPEIDEYPKIKDKNESQDEEVDINWDVLDQI